MNNCSIMKLDNYYFTLLLGWSDNTEEDFQYRDKSYFNDRRPRLHNKIIRAGGLGVLSLHPSINVK